MKTKIIISDTAKLTPAMWGGPIRILNLYKNLSKKFEITYVGVDCRKNAQRYEKKINKNFREIELPITKLYFPVKWIELHLLKHLTFDLFTYLLMPLDANFKKELNKDADILIASHVWTSPCFKKKRNQIMVYDAHNCEYILIKKILGKSIFTPLVFSWVKLIERNACKKSDLILACSEENKNKFVELYKIAPEKVVVIPNGTNITPLPSLKRKKRAKQELNVKRVAFFVGAFYKPNIEAVDFISKEIAPKIKDCSFLIAGSVCNAFKGKKLPENIKLYGQISNEQLKKIITASDIALNPIFSGSGINIKMLDYLSNGLPVITTEFGARGIRVNHGKEVIVSKPEDFVSNIKMLFENGRLMKKLEVHGRKIAEQVYDWKLISKNLENTLTKVIKHENKL